MGKADRPPLATGEVLVGARGRTLMKRPVASHTCCWVPVAFHRGKGDSPPLCPAFRSGYTLVEILVATTLSLILLGAVVQMFGSVGRSITDSRSMLEMSDRLRVAATRLQMDLAGVTVTMNPPRRPENNEGYFEYIEGPVTQANASTYALSTDNGSVGDTTVGDFDDILMFTTRNTVRPFVGRYGTSTIQSDVAEVAWFVRGRTLYRRVLLVAPGASLSGATAAGFYANYDISARVQGGVLVPNTLGDLTKRECRFAHPTDTFPYDPRRWQWKVGTTVFPTLPTLRECSSAGWNVGTTVPPTTAPFVTNLDFWTNDTTKRIADNAMTTALGYTDGTRIADDVILTNVIGFDVKAWDPTAGAYIDLGYGGVAYTTANYATVANGLSHFGHPRSGLVGSATTACIYDTYSFHYECDGVRESNGAHQHRHDDRCGYQRLRRQRQWNRR